MKRLLLQKITIPLAAGLLGLFLFIPSPSWAVSLGAGDYEFTSGDLLGGTFTINGSGGFSAWNITFPMTSFSSLINFQSPSPTPVSNGATTANNVLTFFVNDILFDVFTRSDPSSQYFYSIMDDVNIQNRHQGSGTVAPVPEPSTLLLSATGLLGLAGYRWLQRRHEGTQVG